MTCGNVDLDAFLGVSSYGEERPGGELVARDQQIAGFPTTYPQVMTLPELASRVLQEAKPVLGPRVFAMLDRYGFATVEEVAAVRELELLDVRHFGPKARLAVDAAVAAHRSVDDPAVAAAQERRRDHI